MLFPQGGRGGEVLEAKAPACSFPIVEIPCNIDISVNKLECRFNTGKDSAPVSHWKSC